MNDSNKSSAVHLLEIGDKQIQLIGTAHVSRESAEQVESLIRCERPDTVCVELCESRYQAIRHKDRWRETDIVKVIREKRAVLLFVNLLLASFQRRIAEKFNLQPGQEMIKAIEAADSVGANIDLADREIRITLSRTWRLMGLWEKTKLFFQLFLSLAETEEITEEDIEKMKQQDVLDIFLSEIGRTHPSVRNVLIDERDRYLAQKIKSAPGRRIVAVVGAGHVPGIRRYIHTDIDLEPLQRIPPGGLLSRGLKWGIPLAIVALIVLGFFLGGANVGKDMVSHWILATGILAAVGAMVAMAHPLTILSAALVAPLTTLHPLIAAGWVSGLVEALIRKPKVRDFEDLPQDIHSVRGFWRNKVTRILLVVVFTNLGATAGSFVGGTFIIKAMWGWVVLTAHSAGAWISQAWHWLAR